MKTMDFIESRYRIFNKRMGIQFPTKIQTTIDDQYYIVSFYKKFLPRKPNEFGDDPLYGWQTMIWKNDDCGNAYKVVEETMHQTIECVLDYHYNKCVEYRFGEKVSI